MTQKEFEALKPGDIITRPGENQEYIVTNVECQFNDVIVTAVRVIRPRQFEQWEKVEKVRYKVDAYTPTGLLDLRR